MKRWFELVVLTLFVLTLTSCTSFNNFFENKPPAHKPKKPVEETIVYTPPPPIEPESSTVPVPLAPAAPIPPPPTSNVIPVSPPAKLVNPTKNTVPKKEPSDNGVSDQPSTL